MVSIIIPTYNESDQIADTISKTQAADNMQEAEIIIVDGGSTDDTCRIAERCGARIVKVERKGRSAQMNKGASIAKGEILYFLHADSIPPGKFILHISNACKMGYASGCFRLSFDHDHWFLKFNAWFTRFDVNAVRFGDQSLFVKKDVFEKSGGFRNDLIMMEDQEIVHRLKKHSRFIVLNDVVITSARKYVENGVYRMQRIFYRLWAMYYLGYSQDKMLILYKKLIRQNKI